MSNSRQDTVSWIIAPCLMVPAHRRPPTMNDGPSGRLRSRPRWWRSLPFVSGIRTCEDRLANQHFQATRGVQVMTRISGVSVPGLISSVAVTAFAQLPEKQFDRYEAVQPPERSCSSRANLS